MLMKRIITVLILSLSLIMLLSACGDKKQENIQHSNEVSTEVNIDDMSMKELISGYAFEAGTDEDGTLEAYVFFEDGKLYYFGKSTKIGTWSISGNKLTVKYTSIDGENRDETGTLTVSVESEIGIVIDGTEFMMIDSAEGYIS